MIAIINTYNKHKQYFQVKIDWRFKSVDVVDSLYFSQIINSIHPFDQAFHFQQNNPSTDPLIDQLMRYKIILFRDINKANRIKLFYKHYLYRSFQDPTIEPNKTEYKKHNKGKEFHENIEETCYIEEIYLIIPNKNNYEII